MKVMQIVIRVAVIGGILFGTVTGAAKIAAMAPKAEKKDTPEQRTPVEVFSPKQANQRVMIEGMGPVVPARKIEVFAEVSGRILAQYDGLIEGAFIPKGTRLVRVDQRDYKYAVDTYQASLAQAQAVLEEERSRKKVAEMEWDLIRSQRQALGVSPAAGTNGQGATSTGASEVALRVPQIKSAEANLRSVKSQLEQARLQVGRTKIVAPFDAMVLRENVETGQLVGPQTSLATLVGTQRFFVNVAVPIEQLQWLKVPGTNTTDKKGSPARVIQEVGNQKIVREGYVVRLLAQLTQEGRMAQVVVAIDDPFQLGRPVEERELPLLLGSYVRVELEGPELENVYQIPRSAVHDENMVWLLSKDNQLEIRSVDVKWTTRQFAIIEKGLSSKDQVVTTQLSIALPGMPLRASESAPDKHEG